MHSDSVIIDAGCALAARPTTEQTRQALDEHVAASRKRPGDFLFHGRCDKGRCPSTRQYARLVSEWIASIGLEPVLIGHQFAAGTSARFSCSSGAPMARAPSDTLASRS
jgi:hypothetical protein